MTPKKTLMKEQLHIIIIVLLGLFCLASCGGEVEEYEASDGKMERSFGGFTCQVPFASCKDLKQDLNKWERSNRLYFLCEKNVRSTEDNRSFLQIPMKNALVGRGTYYPSVATFFPPSDGEENGVIEVWRLHRFDDTREKASEILSRSCTEGTRTTTD